MLNIVKVYAPASVANIACGFDILGLAIDAPGDIIVAKKNDSKELRITKITGDNGLLPLELSKNTAGFAAWSMLDSLGLSETGIDLEIHKKMPFSSGLGSSAASAAGAVFAIKELMNLSITKLDLLRYAVLGEERADGAFHADNVAPSLLGGIVLIRDNSALDIIELPVPKQLFAVLVHPNLEVLTQDARGILSKDVSLDSHILQSGNLGAFIAGLYMSDYKLISRSIQDHIIEKQRKALIPGFDDLKSELMGSGSLGVSISGSGPSIFSLCKGENSANISADIMKRYFEKNSIGCQVYSSRINQEGAKRIE